MCMCVCACEAHFWHVYWMLTIKKNCNKVYVYDAHLIIANWECMKLVWPFRLTGSTILNWHPTHVHMCVCVRMCECTSYKYKLKRLTQKINTFYFLIIALIFETILKRRVALFCCPVRFSFVYSSSYNKLVEWVFRGLCDNSG